ncbi:MAG: flavodoxin family protein [Desulfofustis sp.]|nr:flavodoxin family protein [Desulfofustis sp.]
MKILVLLGSPRRKGNSESAAVTVVDQITATIGGEAEYIRLTKENISPCIACGGCEKTGECIVKDGMVDLYDKIDGADLLFLVSPTYFYGLSAQMKGFIDRIQCRWSRKYLLKTPFRKEDRRLGYLICTAATHGKKLFDGSILVAKSFYDAIDVRYGGELLIRGVDQRGEFSSNQEEIEKAQLFAREITSHFPD